MLYFLLGLCGRVTCIIYNSACLRRIHYLHAAHTVLVAHTVCSISFRYYIEEYYF